LGLENRIRRLESAKSARAQAARASPDSKRAADYERLFELIEHARQHGPDASVPEHLRRISNPGSERATIQCLRSSGSGWDTDPEAKALLEAWERDLRA